MTTGTLKIHTENILPIIKKWLYSDKDIFVRELVSNACDAIQKCRVLREHGELASPMRNSGSTSASTKTPAPSPSPTTGSA